MTKRTPLVLAVLAAAGLTLLFAGQAVPKAGLPVLTTSAGQSTDVTTVNIVLDEAGIAYDYCDVPTPEMVADGVGLGGRESGPGFHVESLTDTAKYPAGTPYKAVIFAIGASLKGMGASGLTLDSEEARLKKLIEYCKSKKIFVMAVHIGGESKRGPAGSDNERMIDAVAPLADYIVVTKESNKDGRFTKLAQAGKVPITEIDYALDLVGIVKQVLQ
ncbi:MAG: hypothetical protein GX465_03620 [Acidobacteria bacterium]|nr:hypothetical protein [Acidobacteriota bacterium]